MFATPAFISLLPAVSMAMGALLLSRFSAITRPWRVFMPLSALAFAASLPGAWVGAHLPTGSSWLALTPLSGLLAALVQLLGTVIGAFSARYLEGEDGQKRYAAALAGVLASVHLLLLANHWLVLIAAWSLIGVALQHLLCFYGDRPFARLAAHKKRLADRLADVLLLAGALLAWHETGSGSLGDLARYVSAHGASPALQCSAVCLALAVVLRTALLPVHGWLIQVMEAPTPVSALLHAGVVNLGGFVLIRFATLLDHAPAARWLLAVVGLTTAVLAGLVMLTRITIKVRLAWSTVAQMGFMVLECGLGLYTFAALHLVGHSLYKAHHFLSASSAVRQTRLQMMQDPVPVHAASLLLAPVAAAGTLHMLQGVDGAAPWPWWWTTSLALAWAPLLWLPRKRPAGATLRRAVAGLIMIAGLGCAASLAHRLPLGLHDTPGTASGLLALLGLAALYGCLILLQWRPQALAAWRCWSYAGFYIDEYYTRLTLLLWPTPWTEATAPAAPGTAIRTTNASAANVY
ncbi:MAG TPA: NADH-quinone oxidoreductase subunit L [Bordetella sp.]